MFVYLQVQVSQPYLSVCATSCFILTVLCLVCVVHHFPSPCLISQILITTLCIYCLSLLVFVVISIMLCVSLLLCLLLV